MDARRLSLAEANENLLELVTRAADEGTRTVIEDHGKPVAVLMPVEDLEHLERLEDEADLRAVAMARAEGGEPIPWETVKRDLGF